VSRYGLNTLHLYNRLFCSSFIVRWEKCRLPVDDIAHNTGKPHSGRCLLDCHSLAYHTAILQLQLQVPGVLYKSNMSARKLKVTGYHRRNWQNTAANNCYPGYYRNGVLRERMCCVRYVQFHKRYLINVSKAINKACMPCKKRCTFNVKFQHFSPLPVCQKTGNGSIDRPLVDADLQAMFWFMDIYTLCSEKNTHSHFLSYLNKWYVNLNKNCSEYT